jgi:transketolase
LITLRPGDANEVVEAWRLIVQLRHNPAVLVLSRQAMPTLDRNRYAPASGLVKGGYILADADGGKPEILFLATGSEVGLAIQVYEKLTAEGVRARVVSLPSWELFEAQPREYRDKVIPPDVGARISIEQGSTMGWAYYHGSAGRAIGMRTFGASAPLKELQKKFGFTPDSLLGAARELLSAKR